MIDPTPGVKVTPIRLERGLDRVGPVSIDLDKDGEIVFATWQGKVMRVVPPPAAPPPEIPAKLSDTGCVDKADPSKPVSGLRVRRERPAVERRRGGGALRVGAAGGADRRRRARGPRTTARLGGDAHVPQGEQARGDAVPPAPSRCLVGRVHLRVVRRSEGCGARHEGRHPRAPEQRAARHPPGGVRLMPRREGPHDARPRGRATGARRHRSEARAHVARDDGARGPHRSAGGARELRGVSAARRLRHRGAALARVLHANCAGCHASADAGKLDLRITAPRPDAQACAILRTMHSTGADHQPPIGPKTPDETALRVLTPWVASFQASCP